MQYLSQNDVHELLDGAKWTFAKSYPTHPHEYTLSRNWVHRKDFDEVVKFIREYGVKRRFYKVHYIYYDYNGYTYWTMGAPVEETILINKAQI